MANLENYYSGDHAWEQYVSALSSEWPKCPFKEALLTSLHDDAGLAVTIYFHLLDDALDWIDQKIPALDSETPRVCAQSEPGRRRLKEMLLRMPL